MSRHLKTIFLAAGIALILLLGLVDLFTARELPFSIFYILPVSLIAWHVSRRAGFLVAAIAALTWFVSDLRLVTSQNQLFIAFMSMVLRFGFFFIGTQLLADLKTRLKTEEELARVDPLTRIPNRRNFYELADTEIRRSLRFQRHFTVAYIDLDNFKLVNDRFGHHTGDTILLIVAQLIQNTLRKFDTVARLGGDEFAILLPETGMESARQVILRLQNVLLNGMQERDWPVTFSIGVVTFTQQPSSVDEMLQQVDNLMYVAKNNGKNSVRHDFFRPS